jgi:hypothetical protein
MGDFDASLTWVLDAAEDWLAYRTKKPRRGLQPFRHSGGRLRDFGVDDTVAAPSAPQKPYLLVGPSSPRRKRRSMFQISAHLGRHPVETACEAQIIFR